ncbi:uncharacterized protein LOC129615702 [Condylostylus longicornis]|uniref:uncharacterized protein LOC129615702 n=1 Tax=Condylostylus longicornis TaxID=2530218 RepID=UPI00244DD450|nr:uncharacterized protein LOC129615702 [Condylostylus longicornis]XP_055387046.1 uncharacterized protein LOC129615702 [Condylostylus longicornis]XP_055387055.1 uncharacterized protein LOC129615702 [Condylostylus longicornis]XP_055387062.1 uncharacterized protein LOC129615702 [Condylostylus longicornis]
MGSKRGFAITIRRTEVIVQIPLKDLQDDVQSYPLDSGTLVRTSEKVNNFKNVLIQIIDYFNKNPAYDNLYKCKCSDLKEVSEDCWPFLIAIKDAKERLRFAQDNELIKYCLFKKVKDILLISGRKFKKTESYCGIIRHIGLVPEIGPGYYFAIEILTLGNGYSPQADEIIDFAEKYTKCDAHLSLIVTANYIEQDTETLSKPKFSTRDLLCGTLDRARSALGFTSTTTANDNFYSNIKTFNRQSPKRHSLRQNSSSTNRNSYVDSNRFSLLAAIDNNNCLNDKQNKENDLNIPSDDENPVMEQKNFKKNFNSCNASRVVNSSHIPNTCTTTRSTSSTSTNTPSYKRNKATNTNFPDLSSANSTNSKENGHHITFNLPGNCDSKESSHQRDDENLITLTNEEYVRCVENYEKNLEQKQLHQQQQQLQQQQQSIIKSSIKTPTNKNIPPVSILKQPKSNLNNSGNINTSNSNLSNKKKPLASGTTTVKPNTILSLEDRDIVVIDTADIKESTMNESKVIVLDNPRNEVDLADLLGTNWPSTAGDAALVLNTDKSSSVHISSSSNSSVSSFGKSERNKSANPISHIMSSKSNIDNKRNKENMKHVNEAISNNSSFDDSSIIGGLRNSNIGRGNKEKKLKNIEPLYDNTNLISSQVQAQNVMHNEPEDIFVPPSPLSEIPDDTGLGVGSMVEVSTDVCEDLYGVIKWIGVPQGSKNVMVGVELEDDPGERPLNLTDGVHNGVRYFKCPEGRAIFIHPSQCSIDRRFLEIEVPSSQASSVIGATGISNNLPINISGKNAKALDAKMFGQVECPPVVGSVAPLKILNLDELEEICGKFKGIQGHHNSCYLDATLFAMFTFTSVFDSLLFRPPEPEDISHYEEVQKVLREEIVNPLRKNVFVRADRVMKLRQLLEKLSSVTGLTCEEKDPEEFLNSLLAQILRADPFLKLSSGQDTFFYQLFVEKDERLSFPSVQQLFEQSFLASDIKLKEVPSCLIIQMPRFGKNFKMYPRILPSQVLDVTDIIEDSPRQCSVCGKLAEYECRECFGMLQCGVGLESTAFCKKCLETVHSHAKRANHTPKEISVPQDFKIMAEHLNVPRLFMELFAVVCIETSHYVAFVKAGSGLDAPWCFFDSMADRKGEQNGYNIPELVTVPDLPQWLSEEGARTINEAAANDKMLPELAKRLLCDAYMCMYQSTDVMMYR